MFWWHYVLGFGVFCVMVFVVLVVGVFAGYIRFTKVSPAIEAVYIDEKGKFIRKLLKSIGLFQTEWRLKSNNPTKVAYKVLPQGIGKATDETWDEDDYLEFDFKDGDKKFVLFGLKNFSFKVGVQMKMLKNMLNNALADSSLWEQKYKELNTKFEDKIGRRLDEVKKLAPIYTKPKTSKK